MNWTQQDKVVSSDGLQDDFFGFDIAIDGYYLIVGASYDDAVAAQNGSVYIFERNGADWSQHAKLITSDGQSGDWFGGSVDISGDYVIVSATQEDEIRWYQNDGSLNFQQFTVISNADLPRSCYPIDINADGAIDILSGIANDDDVMWFANDAAPGLPDVSANATLAFGTKEIGGDHTATLSISNTGAGTLTVTDVSVTGSGFSTDFGGQFTISGGSSSNITVTFSPTVEDDYSETLTITSDDADEGTVDVTLTGSVSLTDWQIGIAASNGPVDNENFVGGGTGATLGYDQGIDLPEPPIAPNNYIALYFDHTDWNHGLYDLFSSDVVDKDYWQSNTVSWEFEVITDQQNEDVTLTFSPDANVPNETLYLVDLADNTLQDLSADNTYNYDSGDGSPHNFRIVFADDDGPTAAVTYPNSGESYEVGDTYQVTWTTDDSSGIDNTVVSYSVDGGTNWTVIGTVQDDGTTIDWQALSTLNTQTLFKIVYTDRMGNTTEDQSDANNSIVDTTNPVTAVTYPNGAEDVEAGTTVQVT